MLVRRADVQRRRPAREAHQQEALSIGGDVALALAAPGDSIEQGIGQLRDNVLICMPCHATWSMHHLLTYLLEHIGPSRTWLTSWTITEGPVRSIVKLQERGLITDLACLFDARVGKYNANALQLAQRSFTRVGLTSIHAKCLVMVNDLWAVTVLSTANITRNKRIELYWISTHREVADHHAAWIEKVLANCEQITDEQGGT